MLCDTHCHLDFEAFDADRAAVIERAGAAGVGRLLNPGTSLESSRAAVQLAGRHSALYAAVGIHPNEKVKYIGEFLHELDLLAGQPQVVAIGEIGLDYYRDAVDRAAQREKFEAQLGLAAAHSLPVIIHCRAAYADARAIVAAWPAAHRAGVFHSFSGSPEDLDALLELGFSIGITAPVTYPKSHALRQLVGAAPLDRILTETDAPFLAPQSRRGQRNEPALVVEVAAAIAAERKLEISQVAAATSANAAAMFGW